MKISKYAGKVLELVRAQPVREALWSVNYLRTHIRALQNTIERWERAKLYTPPKRRSGLGLRIAHYKCDIRAYEVELTRQQALANLFQEVAADSAARDAWENA